MGLLLVYGLNTWLPKIMGEAGYSITAGTTLLLVLNLGAVIGLLVAGGISDKRGNKPTVLLWFRGTALGMAAGVGRVGAIVGPFLGGLLVTAGLAYPWGFYAFAVAAVLAVVALSLVPAHLDPSAED